MAQRGFSHFIKQADEMMDSQCTLTETLPDTNAPGDMIVTDSTLATTAGQVLVKVFLFPFIII